MALGAIGFILLLLSLVAAPFMFVGDFFHSITEPAKPTKQQPKQGKVTNEKERLIFTDPKTGLMWPINGNIPGKKMSWVEAMFWVSSLNHAGYNDWRLPSKAELEDISHRCGVNAADWLNANGFNNFQRDGYFSSSSDAEKPEDVWGVNMSDSVKGHYYLYPKDFRGVYLGSYVWPVRGYSKKYGEIGVQQQQNEREFQNAKAAVAKIEAERKKELDEKERRNNLKGTVVEVDKRFVFRYLTVKDNRTGLMWTRDANLGWQNWYDSVKLIKELNKNNYASHNDWRLPSKKELLTLISYAKNKGYADPYGGTKGPSALFNQMGFFDVQHGHIDYMTGYYYWTSSKIKRLAPACVVSMHNGYDYTVFESEKHYVWPVRSDR